MTNTKALREELERLKDGSPCQCGHAFKDHKPAFVGCDLCKCQGYDPTSPTYAEVIVNNLPQILSALRVVEVMPEIEKALEKHQEFFDCICNSLFDDCSTFDGSDVEEWADKCGLLTREPYDPAKHGNLAEYIEPGEDILQSTKLASSALAALQSAKAPT